MNFDTVAAPKLPALRLTAEEQCVIQDAITLELPVHSKFSVSYASDSRKNSSAGSSAPLTEWDSSPPASAQAFEGNSGGIVEPEAVIFRDFVPPNSSLDVSPSTSMDPFLRMPELPRTVSMPLPSQLSQLQHPHRPDRSLSFSVSPIIPHDDSPEVQELSIELADSIQMIVQTMLQISPPQVLDPAKEQFSACSLSVPTSSMSAMFTAMKNINYISANMAAFCKEASGKSRVAKTALQDDIPSISHNEFDIGELLQCVGDALSGAAAQVGVDLVIYHADVSLKHIYVSGEESAISYAISHVIRQILNVAERGDSIELGLNLLPSLPSDNPPTNTNSPGKDNTENDDVPKISSVGIGTSLGCTIWISHKYAFPERCENDPYGPEPQQTRDLPTISALLLRRILRQIEGTLEDNLPPPPNFASGRTTELRFPLRRVRSPTTSPGDPSEDAWISPDATLQQLLTFSETLKGKRVTLYASSKGSFAQHLSSYLTAWGMDVSHVSPDGNMDGMGEVHDSPAPEPRIIIGGNPLLSTYLKPADLGAGGGVPANIEARRSASDNLSFIIIDDDVDVLKERLQSLQMGHHPPPILHLNSKKRPSLSSLHRPRSTPHIVNPLGQSLTTRIPPPTVILHFTSLSNYKILKDVIQSTMTSCSLLSTPLPEVMIIPKPAGPRRFLTALHTAVTKPSVDPQFLPIATSPVSPSLSPGSFFGGASVSTDPSSSRPSGPQPQSPAKVHRPPGSRSNSDRSTKSNRDLPEQGHTHPPSPLALPDNVEYFSAAAQKLGTSPSSGLVIQSPDGQPTGIFFHPKSRSNRNPSIPSMERDRGQLVVPGPRRVSTPRVSPNGNIEGVMSFSSLHAASSSSSSNSTTEGSGTLSTPVSSPNGRISEREKPSPSSGSGVLSSASAMLSPNARRVSQTSSKATSPPGSPYSEGTPSRRAYGRKTSQTDKEGSVASSSSSKKGKASEGNIVPPISVLIVDDNPINQTILSTFMKKKRIKYDLASNGQEAVQKWRTGGFHLILMDIQMPVMDGIQATKEIRRMEKTNAAAGYPPLTPTGEGQKTPSEASSSSESKAAASPYRSSVIIVALTASSLQSDRVAALAAGCNDFLTKPVSLLWLNNKIIEWGSIKALQMWADLRPEAVRNLSKGQAVQARAIAERLHVPKGRTTPSPSRSATLVEENAAAIALASPSGTNLIPKVLQASSSTSSIPSSSALKKPRRPSNDATPTASPRLMTRRRSSSPDTLSSSTEFSRTQSLRRIYTDSTDEDDPNDTLTSSPSSGNEAPNHESQYTVQTPVIATPRSELAPNVIDNSATPTFNSFVAVDAEDPDR